MKVRQDFTDYKEYRRQDGRNRRKSRTKKATEQAQRAFPMIVGWAIVGLIVIVAITNIRAWHAALGLYLQLKFEDTYTLGGLFISPLFDDAFRLFILGLIAYAVFFKKRKKSWFDWVGVVLMAFAVVAGSASLTAQGSWVLAVILWYVFQSLQFEGIFESSSGTARTLALGTYCLEFVVQCAQAPISEFGFIELYRRFSTGTLQPGNIDWWMVLVNILCMTGVEWLIRWKIQLDGSDG